MKSNNYFLLATLLLLALPVFSQEVSLDDFNAERLRLNKAGMQVLGGWAIVNLGVSGIAVWQTSGEVKAFHQMNIGWGLVNLSLAGFGYHNALHAPTDLGAFESISAHESLLRIFLFNAGLDVAYMAGGAYMIERSKNVEKNSERLSGFGKSVIMQGAFLFLFDGIMYLAHLRHGNQELAQVISGLSLGPNGIGYTLRF